MKTAFVCVLISALAIQSALAVQYRITVELNGNSPPTVGLLQVIFAGPGFKHAVKLTPGPTLLEGGHYYTYIANVPYYQSQISEAQIRYDRTSSPSGSQYIFLDRLYMVVDAPGGTYKGFCGGSPQDLSSSFWYRLTRLC